MKNLLWLFKYKWINRKCPHICTICKFKKNGSCVPKDIKYELTSI